MQRFRTPALLSLLLVAAFAVGSGSSLAAPKKSKKERIKVLRQRLQSLKASKLVKQQQLRQTKRTQRRLSDQLNDSYVRLEAANESLKASATRLRRAEESVRAATRRLELAEEKLEEQQDRFSRRIALHYKEGPTTYLSVLLGSGDISEMLDRRYYVSRVFNVDSELLSQLRTAQEAVARERRALVTRRTELSEAHRDNAMRVQRVAEEANEREDLLKAVGKERALQEQRLAELEEDSNQVQRTLESELARRLANPGRYRNLGKWTGSLMRPVSGRISSGFGPRFHPILRYSRMHTGVDFNGGTGTPVRAAATGEVFSASWRGGYGQCIILLHGGGMSTLYAHLSRIYVRPGQGVKRGQVIGAIGSTGLSTGPHLHFELRRNGAPVNPL